MTNPQAPAIRTQADDFNRLIAVAFEKQVNAEAYAANVEQRLALAAQMLEAERAKVAELQAKLDEKTANSAAKDTAAA